MLAWLVSRLLLLRANLNPASGPLHFLFYHIWPIASGLPSLTTPLTVALHPLFLIYFSAEHFSASVIILNVYIIVCCPFPCLDYLFLEFLV